MIATTSARQLGAIIVNRLVLLNDATVESVAETLGISLRRRLVAGRTELKARYRLEQEIRQSIKGKVDAGRIERAFEVTE